MVVVNWCGHGQEFVLWPEKDGYWVLVPISRHRSKPTQGLRDFHSA